MINVGLVELDTGSTLRLTEVSAKALQGSKPPSTPTTVRHNDKDSERIASNALQIISSNLETAKRWLW